MKVFVLEDSPVRNDWFKKTFAGHDLTIVDNVEDGVSYMEKHKPDVMFLDHDLGGMVYVSTTEPNTGSGFLRTLKKKNIRCNQIFIHSMNTIGASNMERIAKVICNDVMTISFDVLLKSNISFTK